MPVSVSVDMYKGSKSFLAISVIFCVCNEGSWQLDLVKVHSYVLCSGIMTAPANKYKCIHM